MTTSLGAVSKMTKGWVGTMLQDTQEKINQGAHARYTQVF